MIIKKIAIILGGAFLGISLLNAVILEINKTSGNLPSGIVPGITNEYINNLEGSTNESTNETPTGFDASLLEEANKWNGSYSCNQSKGKCYTYSDNQSLFDYKDQFSVNFYEGAGLGEKPYDENFNFKESYNIYTQPVNGYMYANGSLNGEEFDIAFNSLEQMESADLDESIKNDIRNSIDMMKETKNFCNNNSSFWACK
ncbi:hypothetical protein AB9G26_04500 [Francisella philomiragia]|uniref:hypothetical protein n=1 Tax=Francisella philomiragia TaxID=28110 RepID=UPI0035165726